jgi:hypothetical protein
MSQLEAYVLNIVSTPHPDGIYPRLLRRASRFAVRARGSDYAKLTRPQRRDDGLYTGRILVWTDIDLDAPWIDLENEDELAEELKRQIRIPANARPNYRTFVYVFDELRHLFFYEARNELDQRLGPLTARRILARLMSHEMLEDQSFDVEVTIIPDEETIGKILRLPGLRKLRIKLNRPNPDDFEAKKRRILRDLAQNSARSMETELVRIPQSDGLTPTEEIKDLAEVAAENGFVEGEAEVDGNKVKLSTREHPRKIVVEVDPEQSVLARLVSYVRQNRSRDSQRT